jgi:hypothetical protein
MVGRWHGSIGMDPIEEHFSAPAAGSIMGMFRWIRDGATRLFEIIAIEGEGDGTIVMRIKHFFPGLKSMEENDEHIAIELVALGPNRAVWHKRGSDAGRWLIYERTGDELQAWFENSGEPAPEVGSRFQYRLGDRHMDHPE